MLLKRACISPFLAGKFCINSPWPFPARAVKCGAVSSLAVALLSRAVSSFVGFCASEHPPALHRRNRITGVSTNVFTSLPALCSVPATGSDVYEFSCSSQDLVQWRCCWPNIFELVSVFFFFFKTHKLFRKEAEDKRRCSVGSQGLEALQFYRAPWF